MDEKSDNYYWARGLPAGLVRGVHNRLVCQGLHHGGRRRRTRIDCWSFMEDFPFSLSGRREELQADALGRTHGGCVRCDRVIGFQHSVGNPRRGDARNRRVFADEGPFRELTRLLTGTTMVPEVQLLICDDSNPILQTVCPEGRLRAQFWSGPGGVYAPKTSRSDGTIRAMADCCS